MNTLAQSFRIGTRLNSFLNLSLSTKKDGIIPTRNNNLSDPFLPKEICEEIISYCDFRTIGCCRRISKGWKDLVDSRKERIITVSPVGDELPMALKHSRKGDRIILLPGIYEYFYQSLYPRVAQGGIKICGTSTNPKDTILRGYANKVGTLYIQLPRPSDEIVIENILIECYMYGHSLDLTGSCAVTLENGTLHMINCEIRTEFNGISVGKHSTLYAFKSRLKHGDLGISVLFERHVTVSIIKCYVAGHKRTNGVGAEAETRVLSHPGRGIYGYLSHNNLTIAKNEFYNCYEAIAIYNNIFSFKDLLIKNNKFSKCKNVM